MARRSPFRLHVTQLEDRTTPVIGAFDTPFVVDTDTSVGADNLLGVVDYNGGCTGSLLDAGPNVDGSRFIVTAAHCAPAVGDLVNFYLRNDDGTLKRISIPVTSVWVHPTWTGNTNSLRGDIAIATLASVAPVEASTYPIYTSAQAAINPEVGQKFIIAGYGRTGTGTSGQAGLDIQRMRITGTGGQFFLANPSNNQVGTVALNYNATAGQITNAFAQLGFAVQVRRPTAGPYTNSFEVLFLAGGNAPRFAFRSNVAAPLVNGPFLGNVTFETLTNGDNDGEFQRITLNATGGTFTLGLNGGVTAPIAYNATAADIQAAIQTLPGVTEATVRLVTSGPQAGSFQVSFDAPGSDVNVPRFGPNFDQMTINTANLTGTGKVITVQDADSYTFGQFLIPTRVLRMGANEFQAISGDTLVSDFDNDGTDEREGQGDSGGASFLDLGGGKLAIAAVVSQGVGTTTVGPFEFGSTTNSTRVSKFTADIEAQTLAFPYTLTLDMQYQVVGNDGIGDTIRVVRNGNRVEIRGNDHQGNPNRLYYADVASKFASIIIKGTADDDTIIIGDDVGVVVTADGGGGNDTLIAPNIASAYTIDGVNQGKALGVFDFKFANVENIIAGNKDDTFTFTTGGKITGNIDGGAGNETLDFTPSAGGKSVVLSSPGVIDGFNGVIVGGDPIGGQFLNFNRFVGSKTATDDAITGFNGAGIWTHTAAGGTYTDTKTGQTMTYNQFEILNGGSKGDTFNVRSTGGPLTINGRGGDDIISVASDAPTNAANIGALGGTLTVDGGTGADQFRMTGTAGNDLLLARVTAASGAGDILGFPRTVQYANLESLFFDGQGGTNSFTLQDDSDTSYGSPTDPASGIVFAANGGNSGAMRVGSAVQFSFTNMSAAAVNGDGNNSGDPDTLLVLGTSSTGYQSVFGEYTVANGKDTVTVSDQQVSFSNASVGPMLGVSIGYTANTPTFSTVYVATGNEGPRDGDVISVTPSSVLNLLIDAQGPTGQTGDRVLFLNPGPFAITRPSDPSLGPPHTRYTAPSGASVGVLGGESIPAGDVGIIAVGSGPGTEARARAIDRQTGAVRFEVAPFPGFTGGITVAAGDVNGDGTPDLIVGSGPGISSTVRIYDGGSGVLLSSFNPYEASFLGGVIVAAGDMDQDGFADIVMGPGIGGGPRVQTVSGRTFSVIRDVFVYEATFRGGVNVATGDFNGDGTPDIVTSTGAGGGPRVVVFDGKSLKILANFFAFDPNSRDGFFAAAGDVNGDGVADIVAGSGAGGPARVRVLSGRGLAVLSDFFLNDPFDPASPTPYIPFDVGVRVAVSDVNGDQIGDIVTAKGPGSRPTVRIYQFGSVNQETNALQFGLSEIRKYDVFEEGYGYGVYIGGS